MQEPNYNFNTQVFGGEEAPGLSVFTRDADDNIFIRIPAMPEDWILSMARTSTWTWCRKVEMKAASPGLWPG